MSLALESDFNADAADGFMFSSMYPNTMAYDRLWHLPDTQYVLHADADKRFSRIAEGASPNFIEASISLLRSDSRVWMTAPSNGRWGNQKYFNNFLKAKISKFD